MPAHELGPPQLTTPVAPAALTFTETAAAGTLRTRLVELCSSPEGRTAADAFGVLPLLDRPLAECRLADLAIAVYRVENATDGGRSALPSDLHLVDPDDAQRHPGFEGVEQECLDEERALLSVRARLR